MLTMTAPEITGFNSTTRARIQSVPYPHRQILMRMRGDDNDLTSIGEVKPEDTMLLNVSPQLLYPYSSGLARRDLVVSKLA
jgi:hypothetical protein